MGNKIARTTQVSASEYYLHDLPSSYNLVLMEVLGRGRFLKSILCKHDEGLVIVKVYFKRGDLLDLKEYERRLNEIREIFRGVQHSHLWPFQFWLETDKAAYLLRQFFFSNLHDRLSTRPFLSFIEKKWLAYQLLCAVKQSHETGVCHGDIKCENVLVTSWNWLYLTDFASFKPTYIPDDDPSDFSFFFDTGGRRRCYLAPERFYEHGGEMQVSPDAPLKPSMDIFSLGCVIAELFLEGQPLFELSQLLAYRRGQYDPCQNLEKIPHIQIRKMILHMIQLDPDSRLSCESYLQEYGSLVFPNYFSPFLHKFFSCMIPLDSDTRVAVTQGAFQEIQKQLIGNSSSVEVTSKYCATNLGNYKSSETKRIMEEKTVAVGSLKKCAVEKNMNDSRSKLANEISSLLEGAEETDCKPFKTRHSFSQDAVDTLFSHDKQPHAEVVPDVRLLSLSREYKHKDDYIFKKMLRNDLPRLTNDCASSSDALLMSFPGKPRTTYCEGMVLIASLLCSCIRSVKQPQLRRGAVLLLMSSSLYIDDEDRLQHVIPYVIAMVSDPAAIVRCAALETLCNILPLIQDFSPSDAKVFPEYILPMLSMLPDDPEESVRIFYCRNIFKIALTAYRFLVISQKPSESSALEKASVSTKSLTRNGNSEFQVKKQNGRTDTELSHLRRTVADIIQELVMGSKQTPNIRRALLQDIGYLCFFFGEKQCNDFLLPILPAFLNDRDEQLRADFFGQIVFVCFFIGKTSVEEYLLPYIEQALNDDMEAVIVNALDCLTMLCKNGYLRKRIILNMTERAFPLLCYPILWVRRAGVSFISASSASLGPVDSHVYLSPLLQPLLNRQPMSFSSERALISCLKPPVSKLVYYQVLQQARGSDMLERQRKIWYNSSDCSNQWETIEHSRKVENECNLRDGLFNSSHESRHAGSAVQKLTIADGDYVAKSRGMGRTACNIPRSIVDTGIPLSSEKLQFSGFISPHVNDGNNLLDVPSEGIPVYSFSVDRRPTRATATSADNLFHLNSSGITSLSAPWMEPVSKSFRLSSSDPPKLFSGSIYNISNSANQVSLPPSQNTGSGESSQSSYISSKFYDVSVSDAKGSSSAITDDVLPQSEGNGVPSFSRSSCVPDAAWRPRGVLVAHLQEHRAAVNDIAISNDQSFFVSVSDDSCVKIWDTRKLEKDISFRSRLTFPLDGTRALCATMLRGTAQVVVGACDGVLHVFSVDYKSRGMGSVVERYSGIADVKSKQVGEGGIISLLNCSNGDVSSSQSILFSTQNCGIHLWDTRTDSTTWKFKTAPDAGCVSSLVMGQCGNWFVSGTSRGVLTLWDTRFLLPVNSWKYSTVCPIEKMCLFIPPPNTTLSAMGRPLIYVAAGCNEVSLWNAENGSCHQVLRTVGCEGDAELPSKVPWALASPSCKSTSKQDIRRNTNQKYCSDELNEPLSHFSGMRALLPLPGGDLLTGGTDLRICYWDHASPARSYCVCGPSVKGIGPENSYDIKSTLGIQVVQEKCRRNPSAKTQKALLAAAATDAAGCHHDSVLSLVSVKLNQRLLISSSRDGAIKVWK